MHTELARPFDGAKTMWPYVPSPPRWDIVLRRWRARWSRQSPPASHLLKPPSGPGLWLMYFMYLPQGQLSSQHRFTLDRLASEDARLMIVCACPPGHSVLTELREQCDALCWKAINGYDFSAYAVGLTELVQHASGSDVMVLNDSMLGPFAPLVPFIKRAPWRLTSLTASALEENHLQSYAFVVRKLDANFLLAVSDVVSNDWCYDTAVAAILLQETRLARVAYRQTSVGAYWYTDGSRYQDLCLNCPKELLNAGFPFLKRSLFGKFQSTFQDPTTMTNLLQRLNHPAI